MSTNEPPPPEQPPSGPTPPPPPPPPAGGYGAPPPTGGYGTPPPGGGYGGPPPGQPAPPAGAGGYNIGNALSYGWAKFQQNFGQIVVGVVVLVVAVAIVQIIGFFISNAVQCDPNVHFDSQGRLVSKDCGSGLFAASTFVSLLFSAFAFIVSMIISAGLVRAALDITEGRRLDPKTLLRTDKLVPVIVASLIIGVASFIGLLLCILPGIAVIFLTQYTLYYILDQDLAPVDAIKASVRFTTQNLGNVLLWYIVGGIIALVGFAICFVGAIVTVPIALIGTAYTYKVLNGQPVAP